MPLTLCDIQVIQRLSPPSTFLIPLSHRTKSQFFYHPPPAVSSAHFLQKGAPIRQGG